MPFPDLRDNHKSGLGPFAMVRCLHLPAKFFYRTPQKPSFAPVIRQIRPLPRLDFPGDRGRRPTGNLTDILDFQILGHGAARLLKFWDHEKEMPVWQ